MPEKANDASSRSVRACAHILHRNLERAVPWSRDITCMFYCLASQQACGRTRKNGISQSQTSRRLLGWADWSLPRCPSGGSSNASAMLASSNVSKQLDCGILVNCTVVNHLLANTSSLYLRVQHQIFEDSPAKGSMLQKAASKAALIALRALPRLRAL